MRSSADKLWWENGLLNVNNVQIVGVYHMSDYRWTPQRLQLNPITRVQFCNVRICSVRARPIRAFKAERVLHNYTIRFRSACLSSSDSSSGWPEISCAMLTIHNCLSGCLPTHRNGKKWRRNYEHHTWIMRPIYISGRPLGRCFSALLFPLLSLAHVCKTHCFHRAAAWNFNLFSRTERFDWVGSLS